MLVTTCLCLIAWQAMVSVMDCCDKYVCCVLEPQAKQAACITQTQQLLYSVTCYVQHQLAAAVSHTRQWDALLQLHAIVVGTCAARAGCR
jgi:hypothetical protein